jgi:outer membrane protein
MSDLKQILRKKMNHEVTKITKRPFPFRRKSQTGVHGASQLLRALRDFVVNPAFRISCFGFLLLSGCGDWSKMPTVPREDLRDIQTLQLQPASVQPTTVPTTIPTRMAATQPAPPQHRLSIEEARSAALENNLDLKVEIFNPTISREAINEEEARFEALFTMNVNYAITDAPTSVRTVGSQGKNLNITPGVSVPLRTGGSLEFTAPLNRNETNNEFATLNPSYSANPQVTYRQPLLRGAGPYYAEQAIRIARFGHLISQARTKLAIIGVLTNVDRAYWQLYAARQNLLVRKQEYDLASAQLDRARRMVQAGAAAEVEVIRAESGVADSLEAVIDAENTIRNRQRDLKRILNKPGLEMDTPVVLVPTTIPRTLYYRIQPDALAREALANRMEMLELELQIAEESSNVRVARNDLLPLVALQYTYGVSGLGGGFDEAFTMVRDKDFEDHTIGVSMEIPIGNEAAKSRLRRALATRLQTLATRDQRTAAIKQELFGAIDQLDTNWYRILAARKRVEAAQRVLDAEIRQFQQGLRNSTDVIDAQTNLANAQSAEVGALADYQISQVDIAMATGTVLGASAITWTPAPPPKP